MEENLKKDFRSAFQFPSSSGYAEWCERYGSDIAADRCRSLWITAESNDQCVWKNCQQSWTESDAIQGILLSSELCELELVITLYSVLPTDSA